MQDSKYVVLHDGVCWLLLETFEAGSFLMGKVVKVQTRFSNSGVSGYFPSKVVWNLSNTSFDWEVYSKDHEEMFYPKNRLQ